MMLSRRTIVPALVVMATLLVGVQGYADAISFLPANTGISMKFIDREVAVTAVGQELFGIFNITQINNATGTTTFWNGNGATDGTQLVGFFENLIVVPNQDGPGGLSFAGGRGAGF